MSHQRLIRKWSSSFFARPWDNMMLAQSLTQWPTTRWRGRGASPNFKKTSNRFGTITASTRNLSWPKRANHAPAMINCKSPKTASRQFKMETTLMIQLSIRTRARRYLPDWTPILTEPLLPRLYRSRQLYPNHIGKLCGRYSRRRNGRLRLRHSRTDIKEAR